MTEQKPIEQLSLEGRVGDEVKIRFADGNEVHLFFGKAKGKLIFVSGSFDKETRTFKDLYIIDLKRNYLCPINSEGEPLINPEQRAIQRFVFEEVGNGDPYTPVSYEIVKRNE